ncbi:hypothetical protein [Paenibacillus sp. sgz500958]|uniref:hypothetical protein n=1 Tax=Paenibacillus sp. sgz500958 TaxID=3242475 RepID=UPI0036D31532
MDIFDLLNAEKIEARKVLESERLQQKITENRKVLGWEDYVRLKAERSLMVDVISLPWVRSHPNISTSGYEHCELKVIIPPDILSPTEYHLRFGRSKEVPSYYDDPARDVSRELWSSYNHGIWAYKSHQVDWCGATRLLTEYRDAGEPIWMRLTKMGEILIYGALPDCIVEVSGASQFRGEDTPV